MNNIKEILYSFIKRFKIDTLYMRWIKEYKKAERIKGILVTSKSDEKLNM
jgi:hypothetical protein